MLEGNRARSIRRSSAIRAYVGSNGSGKSLAMVHDLIPSLQQGRKVLSTVAILDHQTGLPHPLYVPFTDFRQLLDWTYGEVLLDEVAGIASSRASQSLPIQVATFLQQLRRRDVTLSWTAPAWARADLIIRECTQSVTVCRGYLPKRSKDSTRLWADARFFKWKTYSAEDFEEWTLAKGEKLKAKSRAFFWRPKSVTQGSYNTFDSVNSLGWASESGLCMTCGGRRTAPKCGCEVVPRVPLVSVSIDLPRLEMGQTVQGPSGPDGLDLLDLSGGSSNTRLLYPLGGISDLETGS